MKKILLVVIIVGILVAALIPIRPISGLIIDAILGRLPPESESLATLTFDKIQYEFDSLRSIQNEPPVNQKSKRDVQRYGIRTGIQWTLFMGALRHSHGLYIKPPFIIVVGKSGLQEVIYLHDFVQLPNVKMQYNGYFYIEPDEPWKKFPTKVELSSICDSLYLKSQTKIFNSELSLSSYYFKKQL
jgi:hypothetical protein